MIDVSVVIPTRDRLALLQEALASLLAQEGPELEVLVVDDGSTDGTREWVAGHDDPRVRVLDNPNRPGGHQSVACNHALGVAEGRHVWFLDDDDVLHPGALRALSGALDAHPAAVAAWGARSRIGVAPSPRIPHPARLLVRDVWREALAGFTPIPSQSLYRADAVRRVGGWRDLWQIRDRDVWIRIVASGPVVLVPDVVVAYRARRAAWPADVETARRALHAELATARPGGERAARAGAMVRAAQTSEDPRRALRLLARAVATEPLLARSPVTWPALREIARRNMPSLSR